VQWTFNLLARTGLIENVDGLVRQKTIADIAVGETYTCFDSIGSIPDAVVALVALPDAVEYVSGLLYRRLLDKHCLEPPLERSVFLEVFTVLVQGGGSDALEFSPRERWLEHVGGIDGAFGTAGTYDGMEFIDEQDDIARGCYLFHDTLEALFKFTAVLCASHDGGHVQNQQALA